MSATRRRILFWLPFAGALVIALVVAFRPQPILVDGATVDRGPLTVTVDAEGKTRTRDVYVVASPLPGRLLRLDLEVGDPVEAGRTVVAELQPTVPTFLDARSRRALEAGLKAAEAALALADAERARAEAEVAFAVSEFRRAQHLIIRGNISESALERAELDLKTSEARLASAEAESAVRRFDVETARAQLIEPVDVETMSGEGACCVSIRAPVDGVVLQLIRESESVVAAGEPILEIGDAHDLEVVVDVLSRDAVRLEPGAAVTLRNWGGAGVLGGEIDQIEPFAFTEISALGIEEQRVNVIVTITDSVERWRRLGHGFRLDASLVVWAADDVVRVPVTALFRGDAGDWHTFRITDGRAETVTVSVGRTNAQLAQVQAGLEPGDVVVRFPNNRIVDGAPLSVRAF